VTLILRASSSELCPVAALITFVRARGNKDGPLFAYPDGSGVSRSMFTSCLKTCLARTGDTDSITAHSFRIGGATYASMCGFSDDEIRRMGRWRSDALLKYIRLPDLLVGPRTT
jgi:hypothetical protein